MQNKNELKYLNALNKIQGAGPKTMRKLMSFFDSWESVWKADLESLLQSGTGPALSNRLISERQNLDPNEEWKKLEQEDMRMITEEDPEYPRLLKEIPDHPYIIYMRGEIDLNRPMISIVGSRKHTEYGSRVAYAFARDLAKAGITVVSGMALGIDSIVHRGALDGGGQTIAVLGDSLDDRNIYPRNNFNLSREIIASGCLLSDYPIETPASTPGVFPARNRIVAGLSMGTLVVEAGEKSGTLITSQLALDYNRDVFTVPGSIFSPQSIGTNKLAKQGAKIVTSVKDILEELRLEEVSSIKPKEARIPESNEEKILLEILSADPLHIDKLSKLSKLSSSGVASTLAMMEIKGWVRNIGGQNYILI